MKKNSILIFFALFFIAGCTANRPSIEEATADGATRLSKQNIKDLVMNNDLQMVSWDKSVEAMIEFNSGGKLVGRNNIGEATHGRWSASNENTLCLRFKFWDDNIQRCYQVFKDGDQYLLFRSGVMENRLIPSEEVLNSLADSNVGIMGSPPPGSNSSVSTTTTTVAPAPAVAVEEKESFLSTFTFGLLGGKEDKKEENFTNVTPEKTYIPEPMPPMELLSAPHQKLIDTGDCPGCDLQGLDLQGVKLKGANLAGANLEGANLQEANLKGANLKGANLISARLTDAILIKADLQGANLSDANIHWADLTKADLRGANLTRCYMVKAIFYKADLTGADFTGAQTQRTIFEKADGVPEHILNRGKTVTDDPLKKQDQQ